MTMDGTVRYRALSAVEADQRFEPGDVFEPAAAGIGDAGVRQLLNLGVIERAPGNDRSTKIAEVSLHEAIAGLDPNDNSLWTKGGAPQLAALRRATGRDDITAAERDESWAAYRAAHGGRSE